MADEKTLAQKKKEELFFNFRHASKILDEDEISSADSFCEGYMDFLDTAKTEREAVDEIISLARANGFEEYIDGVIYPEGSKIYKNNRGKSVMLAVIGKKSIGEGVKIAAAHIDSPRLDLKSMPLYEDCELAYFKTHYYGGIKKYQWTAVPLSLHGVIVKKNGNTVNVCVGEEADEPKFVITDLLPHLAAAQMKRNAPEMIRGEELNVLIGSRPFDSSDESENVKLAVLNILFEKYAISEADFLSAELELVPAYKACDIGFDASMIGSYGHDDRVCAYPAAMAAFDTDFPEYTVITVLTDKEETGSDGNTGLNSSYLTDFISDLADSEGLTGRAVMSRSECLSADVNAAFDPTFPDVLDKRNACFINKGVVLTKYTGSRGKYGTNDANAEFIGKMRALLDSRNVIWQAGELGKVDEGGGGTVAKYVAAHNIETIDLGVPVLSMHAPFEVVAKTDVYMAYRAFYEFFN